MGKYANIAQYAVAPYTRAGSSDFLRSCFIGFSAGRYTNTAHDTESSHSKLLFLQARVDGHRPLLSYWQRGYAPNSKSQEVRTYHLNVSRTSRPSHPHLAHLGCYGASFSRTRFSRVPSRLLWCEFFTYTIFSCPISVAMVQVFHVHGAAQLISVAMVRVFHVHGAAQHSSPCNL